MGVTVVSMRHATKPFLSSSVPYLKLNQRIVNVDYFIL